MEEEEVEGKEKDLGVLGETIGYVNISLIRGREEEEVDLEISVHYRKTVRCRRLLPSAYQLKPSA
jgi:hypothetical protein